MALAFLKTVLQDIWLEHVTLLAKFVTFRRMSCTTRSHGGAAYFHSLQGPAQRESARFRLDDGNDLPAKVTLVGWIDSL